MFQDGEFVELLGPQAGLYVVHGVMTRAVAHLGRIVLFPSERLHRNPAHDHGPIEIDPTSMRWRADMVAIYNDTTVLRAYVVAPPNTPLVCQRHEDYVRTCRDERSAAAFPDRFTDRAWLQHLEAPRP